MYDLIIELANDPEKIGAILENLEGVYCKSIGITREELASVLHIDVQCFDTPPPSVSLATSCSLLLAGAIVIHSQCVAGYEPGTSRPHWANFRGFLRRANEDLGGSTPLETMKRYDGLWDVFNLLRSYEQ